MISYNRFQLENGLRVIVQEEPDTALVAVNIAYDVGARDEHPDKTGFAHLFEHLMFSGSKNIPDFDMPIQQAGGECNAFTSSDLTNYYDILPVNNLEVAFWLESDRMLSLDFDPQSLEIQKKVVCEEFKENFINRPYGNVWHQLRALSYQSHPYRWPVIGKDLSHVENASLQDMQAFFYKYYRPNNAVLVVTGGVQTAKVKSLAQKWFGEIEKGETNVRKLPQEAAQKQFRSLTLTEEVPAEAIYLSFHSTTRSDPDYYVSDLITDILAVGLSSRFYQKLVKDKELFSYIDTYISSDLDEGLLVIYGHVMPNISLEDAEAALWELLEDLKNKPVENKELQKVKNKVESQIFFAETSVTNNAINLAFYEIMGDVSEMNREAQQYSKVDTDAIQRVSQRIFQRENCSAVYYRCKKGGQ